jgi:diguanylate cyclase (GGDEF)-like protein
MFNPVRLRNICNYPLVAILLLTGSLCLHAEAEEKPAPAYDAKLLNVDLRDVEIVDVTSGILDSQFKPFKPSDLERAGKVFWLKFTALSDFHADGTPVLMLNKSRDMKARLFSVTSGKPIEITSVISVSRFAAAHQAVFLVPEGIRSGQSWYVQIERPINEVYAVNLGNNTLQAALKSNDAHAQVIDLAFGALMALSLSVMLIWLVLKDPLLIHYSLLILMQALYIAYFSGQAFDWPGFKYALPLDSYMWNVPIALSGAFACLFVRDITDMKHFAPRAHRVFGWMSMSFVVLAISNVVENFGLAVFIARLGNVIFLGTAIFTLVMAFLAWRRGSRAAGFFMVAWTLLEVFTIATTLSLLAAAPANFELMLYYGLPISMVTAAILMGLGVADRMREQRRALSDAERRAQTDPLTGVLNRRSFLERLEAACSRAQARALPISLLFIDLDHFKQINDTFGHLAGDACLKAVIPAINAELRQSDVIGRYGGEEFVVLLSSADAQSAHPLAERILKRIADVRVEGFGKPIRLTCSIGVATSDMLGEWGERLIAHADTAVYAAKLSGRNRVQLAQSLAIA